MCVKICDGTNKGQLVVGSSTNHLIKRSLLMTSSNISNKKFHRLSFRWRNFNHVNIHW